MDEIERNELREHEEIENLVDSLGSQKIAAREWARKKLTMMDGDAIPALMHLLSSGEVQTRIEAAHLLADIADPRSAHVLIEALRDEDGGVRWAAANALSALNREALMPLMEALMAHFESVHLRQGAHHILHTLKDRGLLTEEEQKVYEALSDPSPGIKTGWAAEAAYEELYRKQHRGALSS